MLKLLTKVENKRMKIEILKVVILPLVVLSALIFYFFISSPYYSSDITNHLRWGELAINKGVNNFYQDPVNTDRYQKYPPLAILSFVSDLYIYKNISIISSKYPSFINSHNLERSKIYYLKVVEILATIGTGIIIYLLTGLIKNINKKNRVITTVLFLFNPATIYLSAIWGQIDFLQLFFILVGFYFFFRDRILVSALFAALALLSKQTVIIYWFILLFLILMKWGWKKFLLSLIINILVFEAVFMPFFNFSLIKPFKFYFMSFSLTDHLSTSFAFNLWGIFSAFGRGVSDSNMFLFLSLHYWGYLFFGLLFLDLSYILLKSKITLEKTIYYLFLVTITYFFFLTRMHERYLIPVIVFSTILTAFSKKYLFSFVFFTIFQFLMLYNYSSLPDPRLDFLLIIAKNLYIEIFLTLSYFFILLYNIYIFHKDYLKGIKFNFLINWDYLKTGLYIRK